MAQVTEWQATLLAYASETSSTAVGLYALIAITAIGTLVGLLIQAVIRTRLSPAELLQRQRDIDYALLVGSIKSNLKLFGLAQVCNVADCLCQR
jgi:hypothetical protein